MHVFPPGLDNTLFPAIFLGVLLTFVATQTLGWSFTGLVAPGYLASVALVAPRAAGLMLVEAALTFAIVRAVAEGGPVGRMGGRFFGRDRFFLTLVVATGIRLVVDRTLLPALGAHGLAALVFDGPDLPAHS